METLIIQYNVFEHKLFVFVFWELMEIKVLIIKQKYPIILWRFPKSLSLHLLKMLR